MTRNPKPEVYTNARGETVMTYAVFQSLTFESVWATLTRGARS